uniref:GTP cyclohydrolase FolE2 n=1 Tax=Candidatus Kentrum sp. FM TaxID=2126340 RepID=A0A450TD14_9GAMM|nr:MAG: GTP cyclohydrolase I [Candidatus Kentron sp. FM]VFJ74097.1 MAG: GTP cyclohydrolase I [Candidatus Kentron sp. FM]VFK17815.1 MAG: GTP cyclohydrolase I [Candidatus Kentron sp. FM]
MNINTNKIDAPVSTEITDVQSSPDTRQIPIQQVGIKGIRHPVRVRDRTNLIQYSIATFNMYVNLPHNFKGTHMSRFVEILNRHEYEITIKSFKRMVCEMTGALDAELGRIEMSFPYFINKVAPETKIQSLMDYEVKLTGTFRDNISSMWIKVVVPAISLCPCSKEIAKYGAHNQRSLITIEVRANTPVWFEELIDIAESQASCQLYGLLKRPDEKFVTEKAFDNPKFVEDTVRDIAHVLNQDDRIEVYTVESENFESIHNHSAYAFVKKNKFNSSIVEREG